jgi:hypothetical protein
LFLTVFSLLPLDRNVGLWAAMQAGQNLVCGRRCDGSRVRPESNNSIEKMVSATTVKSQKRDSFAPSFGIARSV